MDYPSALEGRFMPYLFAYFDKLPEGEIFSVQDWLASLEPAQLHTLDSVFEAVVCERANEPTLFAAMQLVTGVGLFESAFAHCEAGRIKLMRSDVLFVPDDEHLGAMYGLLLAEGLRREGCLDLHALSLCEVTQCQVGIPADTSREDWLKHPKTQRYLRIQGLLND